MFCSTKTTFECVNFLRVHWGLIPRNLFTSQTGLTRCSNHSSHDDGTPADQRTTHANRWRLLLTVCVDDDTMRQQTGSSLFQRNRAGLHARRSRELPLRKRFSESSYARLLLVVNQIECVHFGKSVTSSDWGEKKNSSGLGLGMGDFLEHLLLLWRWTGAWARSKLSHKKLIKLIKIIKVPLGTVIHNSGLSRLGTSFCRRLTSGNKKNRALRQHQ